MEARMRDVWKNLTAIFVLLFFCSCDDNTKTDEDLLLPVDASVDSSADTSVAPDTGLPDSSEGSCRAAVADYGDCRSIVGWASDGLVCREVGGCDCEPDCDAFYPDAASCLEACGGCNEGILVGGGIGAPPAPDGWCDELSFCVEAGQEDTISDYFLDAVCPSPQADCGDHGVGCTVSGVHLTDHDWARICGLSRASFVYAIMCTVWGP